MKRRDALAAILASAAAPLARAQRAPRRVATFTYFPLAGKLEAALRSLGWSPRDVSVEGVVIPLPNDGVERAAEQLVATRPDVLVTQRSTYLAALARKTRTIPIVSAGIADPVAEGVGASLRRPGGNVTGLSNAVPEAASLQLGTMKALMPGTRRVVFVSADPTRSALPDAHVRAAAALGLDAEFQPAPTAAQYEAAIERLHRSSRDAVWLGDLPRDADPRRISELAIRRGVGTIAQYDRLVYDGALFSLWLVHSRLIDRTAAIVHRVLRGESPAGIPFELPDTTLFRLNRTSARRLGLRVPDELLLRVTEFVD